MRKALDRPSVVPTRETGAPTPETPSRNGRRARTVNSPDGDKNNEYSHIPLTVLEEKTLIRQVKSASTLGNLVSPIQDSLEYSKPSKTMLLTTINQEGLNSPPSAIVIRVYESFIRTAAETSIKAHLKGFATSEEIIQDRINTLSQEIMTRIPHIIDLFNPETTHFRNWLRSIISNLNIDIYGRHEARVRKHEIPLPAYGTPQWKEMGVPEEHADDPYESIARKETQQKILTAIRYAFGPNVNDTGRTVLILKYWYDLSYDEIAKVLGITPALVKTKLHNARVKLKPFVQDLAPRPKSSQANNDKPQTD